MSRKLPPAALAAVAAAAAGLLYLFVFRTGAGRAADDAALSAAGFLLPGEALEDVMEVVVRSAGPVPFTLASAYLLWRALRSSGPGLALRAGVVLLGANLTTQILKNLTAHPRIHEADIAAESWPSGHSTAAATLVVVALVVLGPRAPRGALVGWAVLIGFGVSALGWHFPSDVLGAWLVTAAWSALLLLPSAPQVRRSASGPTTARPSRSPLSRG